MAKPSIEMNVDNGWRNIAISPTTDPDCGGGIVVAANACLQYLSNIAAICADFGVVFPRGVRRRSDGKSGPEYKSADRNASLASTWRMVILVSLMLLLGP